MGRLTLADIARICGVSKGTVNRALHGKRDINPQTKARVLSTVEALEYTPSYRARFLATGKSHTVGILLPNIVNYLFASLYTAMERAFWTSGYVVNLALSYDQSDRQERAVSSFAERQLDGIILFAASNDPDSVKPIVQSHIPLVLIINRLEGVDAGLVTVDDDEAMRSNVKHLVGLGHRRIGYIDGYRHFSPKYNDYSKIQRYTGYRRAMAESGLPEAYVELNARYYLDTHMAQGSRDGQDCPEVDLLFARKDAAPSALVCFSDVVALWVLGYLERKGLRVPADLSITGFDNIHELRYVKPRLTTSEVPVEKVAQEAVALLFESMDGRPAPAREIRVPATFVPGDSTAPPAQR